MTERDLERRCISALTADLRDALIWKIRDQTTGGQPDLEVNWNGATTKLEFKRLQNQETVQSKWEDGRQLATLVRYEQTTGRAWVVAWRIGSKKFEPETFIYRPSALLHGRLPSREIFENTNRLWVSGVAWWPGIHYDVVARVIRETHQ